METRSLKVVDTPRAIGMNEQLPIPGWIPLVPAHLKLLAACATEAEHIPSASTGTRHPLETSGLICHATTQSASGDPTYIATEKGLRALRVQRIMKELGIVRQRRPLARFPDNDLVRLLIVLEHMVAAHRRVIAGMPSAPYHS
jgi:hypothetical protein